MNPGSPLYAIAPGLLFTFLFFAGMPFYALRRRQGDFVPHPELARRRPSFVATTFMIGYLSWIIDPLERALASARISPNLISYTSVMCCLAAGICAATGYLASAAWIYVLAGVLDILDGRIARRTGRTSPAGALLDSVLDRWGEFFVLGGLVFTLHTTMGTLAVLICIAGSQMVSYTRARSEGLGVRGDGGSMQRAERIVGVVLALLIGAVGRATEMYDAEAVIAMMLFAIGVASAYTSIGRLIDGMRALKLAETARVEELTPPPAPLPTPQPAPSRLRTLQPRE